MKALIVDDLVVRYGGFVAVRGASFEVEAGEIVGLLGPIGAGKSMPKEVISVTSVAPVAPPGALVEAVPVFSPQERVLLGGILVTVAIASRTFPRGVL